MKHNILKVKVMFFANIREVFQENEVEIELERESSIRDFLGLLCNTHERRQRIFDQFGHIREDLWILKNGRQIQFLDGLQTKLTGGDTVSIFPPVYGG
jgi:molybdopterin synthase sulfur carrier subunit